VLVGTLGAVALFYLLLIHAPPFRAAVWAGIVGVWRLLRGLVLGWAVGLLPHPAVEAILAGPAAMLAWRFIGRPLFWACPVALVLWLCGIHPVIVLGVTAACSCSSPPPSTPASAA